MTKAMTSVGEYGLTPDKSGKVRDMFDLGDNLLIVATDRISAYDVILPDPIPGKGIILTQMTLGWYDHFLKDLETHYITSNPDDYPDPFKGREELYGRSMLVRKAVRFEVECVVRGYLSGSAWREYREKGSICGVSLPRTLVESGQLPEPIFTPATKASSGHDENITYERMKEFMSEEEAGVLRELSLKIYTLAHDYAKRNGVILADTKFEFGRLGEKVISIDELLSPDSSRFWPASSYRPGGPQVSFDKQFVRDYLDGIGWDRNSPAPELPLEIVEKTFQRYMEACHRLFPDIEVKRFL